jgi:hypothetical protein
MMWEVNVPHLPINMMHQEFVVTVVVVVVPVVVGKIVIMHQQIVLKMLKIVNGDM